MTNSPPSISSNSTVSEMNYEQGASRSIRHRHLHRPSLPSQSAIERWYTLREERNARDRIRRSLVLTHDTTGTRTSHSSIPRRLPMFPRFNPFLPEDDEPCASSASPSSGSTRTVVSRARLVSVLQEALDISDSINVDATPTNNNYNDTSKG
jgi:hypothetical protein